MIAEIETNLAATADWPRVSALALLRLPRDEVEDLGADVLFGGEPLLDLNYQEDSEAQVDLNLVATASGAIVEVQGTAEGAPMTRAELDALIDLGLKGVAELTTIQNRALKKAGVNVKKLVAE